MSWHHRNVNMLILCNIKISGVRLTRKSCIVGLVYEIKPITQIFFVGCSHVLVVKTWMECNRMELQGSWDTFLTPCLKNSYCTKAFKNFTKSKATAKYICLHMYINQHFKNNFLLYKNLLILTLLIPSSLKSKNCLKVDGVVTQAVV